MASWVNGVQWRELTYGDTRGWAASRYLQDYEKPPELADPPAGHVWAPLKDPYSISFYFLVDVDAYVPPSDIKLSRLAEDYRIAWRWGGLEVIVPFGALFGPEGVAMQGSGVVTINGERRVFKLDNPGDLNWSLDDMPVRWNSEMGRFQAFSEEGWIYLDRKANAGLTIINPEDAKFVIERDGGFLVNQHSLAGAPNMRGLTVAIAGLDAPPENEDLIFTVDDAGGAFPNGSTRFDLYFDNREEGMAWFNESWQTRTGVRVYVAQPKPAQDAP